MTATLDIIVIGTAGRHHVAEHTPALYTRMLEHAAEFVQKARAIYPGHTIRLVSGGAAWADHLAVKLFLNKEADALDLHLPATFNREQLQYEPLGNPKAAATSNKLHHQFSLVTGLDSLSELDAAIRLGATYREYSGFFKRNDAVAARLGLLVAYTFFPESAVHAQGTPGYASAAAASLTGGGTAYTWDQAQQVNFKLHQSCPALLAT